MKANNLILAALVTAGLAVVGTAFPAGLDTARNRRFDRA
jgi:hypothetical protein